MDREARYALIDALPKAELHLHIEGSLEPEMLFALAERNAVAIPFASVEEVRAAYDFSNLQDFLDIYYQGMSVLLHEQDFFDLTFAYLERAHADAVRHVEIFFDPQGHTERVLPSTPQLVGYCARSTRGRRVSGSAIGSLCASCAIWMRRLPLRHFARPSLGWTALPGWGLILLEVNICLPNLRASLPTPRQRV